MPISEKNHRGRKVLTVIVLALLILLSVVNFRIIKAPLSKFVRHNIGFEDFAGEVQDGYISDNFIRPCFKNDKAMCYFNKIAIAAM